MLFMDKQKHLDFDGMEQGEKGIETKEPIAILNGTITVTNDGLEIHRNAKFHNIPYGIISKIVFTKGTNNTPGIFGVYSKIGNVGVKFEHEQNEAMSELVAHINTMMPVKRKAPIIMPLVKMLLLIVVLVVAWNIFFNNSDNASYPMPLANMQITPESMIEINPEPSTVYMSLECAMHYAVAEARADVKEISIDYGTGFAIGKYDVRIQFYDPRRLDNIRERNMMFNDIITIMPYIQERIAYNDDINWVQFYLYTPFIIGESEELRQTVRMRFYPNAIISTTWSAVHLRISEDLFEISGNYWLNENFRD